MKTDWNLIRDVLNAAIDSCERLEQAGYAEEQRSRSVQVGGRQVNVLEFLISAWTLPENVRYEIIRARHDENLDLPYVPETARILTAVAAACAELIGAGGRHRPSHICGK
jgi:HD-like signal output (HDOD) protein